MQSTQAGSMLIRLRSYVPDSQSGLIRTAIISWRGSMLLILRQLIFPCYELDHGRAFFEAIRRLAYETAGHIKEDNLSHHDYLHMPPHRW